MRSKNQNGSTSVIVGIVMTILFIGAAVFGGWAFMERQDYKNNADKKAEAAVAVAAKAQEETLKQQFEEEKKNPNRTYQSPTVMGSVTFKYPKTWSAYVDTGASGGLNGYFYPGILPGFQSGTAYALRVEVVNAPYADSLRQQTTSVLPGEIKVNPFIPAKMKNVPNTQMGVRINGVISQNGAVKNTGTMVMIAVRDKTLKIYTESPNFLNDFDKIVLPSLTFSP